jgi:hypothetical protein
MANFSAFSHRSLAAWLACALLAGCSSGSTTPGTPLLGGPNSDQTFEMRIVNSLNNYVWVTRYWSYKAEAGWHIDGASCLAPHSAYQTDIHYSGVGGKQARLRIEVKSDAQCTHTVQDGDKYGPICNLNFDPTKSWGTISGEAGIDYHQALGYFVTPFHTWNDSPRPPCD